MVVPDLLLKLLTILELLLVVDMLSGELRLFCVDPLTWPSFFIGTYISQRLALILWFSMDLGLPTSIVHVEISKFPVGASICFSCYLCPYYQLFMS